MKQWTDFQFEFELVNLAATLNTRVLLAVVTENRLRLVANCLQTATAP